MKPNADVRPDAGSGDTEVARQRAGAPLQRVRPRLLVAAALSMTALGAGSRAALAQTSNDGSTDWPIRPIRMITPWSPGAGTDIVSRVVADRLRGELNQPVIVENRPGAAGNIGAEFVARQPGDGYTLMMTSASFAIAPAIYRTLAYDPLRDFVPVTKVATAPLLVLVGPQSPINSMADLIAAAKAADKPGGRKISYGSFGNGSPSHLMGESINKLAGISMTHVPYTGGGAAVDLVNGSVEVAILDALSMTPQVKAGKVKALALNGTQRLPALPDVPTLIQAGIAFDTVGWHALFAPVSTPAGIVARLNRAVNHIVAQPDVQARINEAGSFPVIPPTTQQQWAEQFRQDLRTWAELVRISGAAIN